MSKEAFFISEFSSKHIGDDGAVMGDFVYSKDLFCEDIHFKRSWMSLTQIAQKSMLVNISDAIAMNAKPTLALIGVVIPKSFSYEQLRELGAGFQKVAQSYGVEVIGGDTTAGEKLMISITIIAKRPSKVLYRSGAKLGDFVAYTGTLGKSHKELTRLMRGGTVGHNARFMKPALKAAFVSKSAKHLHAGMDISDGLSKDLSRLLKASGNLGLHVKRKMPKKTLCSGEEYEMLFTFDSRKKKAIERIAKQTRTKMTIIGKVARKRYVCRCKEHHF
ncbi:thiamine-phosphate kinase [Sulfurospirillum multivorans]|uniref:Thiamine-monophosphate kinase n=2 Tax=Sulfurospirillum multivorans TaxID=66821 RepID=A0AA86ANB3_SULMK|nr:thiamine-phosphate kinase [Sulfurospirillum multivorans]AHJ12598.1 thiamine-monophosphate kinase [Sulfurospirillum multivorans DSM 12446]QEH06093.1 thiamine-monophosphate kinase [Sulfurospirillum multivorans]